MTRGTGFGPSMLPLIALAVWALSAGGAFAADPEPGSLSREQRDFFEKRIRPVLVKRCYECHSQKSKIVRGGLLLDTRAGLKKGGESGPAIVLGKPDESPLIDAMRYDGFEMPPDGQLAKNIVDDFSKWIAMGAPDPRRGKLDPRPAGIDLEQGRRHWSFQRLEQTPAPSTKNVDWPHTDIDRFISAKWEAEGVSPVGDADRRTLLRRAYFDLIGLPPSPAEMQAFLNDSSNDAFTRVVDRLLASPHFGERWGRHWLDVVRYADSSGGGRTRVFENAWRYRDYVIRAFNSDKPFDRFIVEQIAGDLLADDKEMLEARRDNLIGTGFLVLAPTNYELQDKELLSMEVVDEQLDTIGRAFLGMTIGCARCHDHKFDPIPTRDYYAMSGILRSTKTLVHANVSSYIERSLPVEPIRQRQLDAHRAQSDPLRQELKVAIAKLAELKKQSAKVASLLTPDRLAGVAIDDVNAILRGKWASSRGVEPFVGNGYRYSSRGASTARYESTLEENGRYEVRLCYAPHANRATNVPVTIEHADGMDTVRVNQRQAPTIDGAFVSLGTYRFTAASPAAVQIDCVDIDGTAIADTVQFLPVGKRASDKQLSSLLSPSGESQQVSAEEVRKHKEAIRIVEATATSLKGRLKTLYAKAPPPAPVTMSVEEEDQPGDICICIRGNVHNEGDSVPRGFLSVVGDGNSVTFDEGESGRLQFAEWIGSRENPLTARVIVNRIWLHLFGSGIVRTPDNLGKSGELPSHPELLDHLAVGFVDDRWSIKKTVRRIMLSHVYQLSSRRLPAAEAVDPENRLLWHMNRRRLEAEAIRDAMLVVSGQLDGRQAGPAVIGTVKSEFDYKFRSLRRGVYLPVLRNRLEDLFEVFDFADPNLVIGKRNTSTIPTQALFLMNSPFLMDQSEHAARKLVEMIDGNDAGRVDYAFRQTLGRPPTAEERRLTLDFVHERPLSEAADKRQNAISAWAHVYQTLFSCIDFRYLD